MCKMKMTYGGGFVREIDRCRELDEVIRMLRRDPARPPRITLEDLPDGSRRWTDTNTGEVVITAPLEPQKGELF